MVTHQPPFVAPRPPLVLPTAVGHPPTAVRCCPTAVCYTPIAVHYPPTAIGYLPTAVCYSPTAVRHPATIVRYSPTAVSHSPTAICYPPTAICYPPIAVCYLPTAVRYPLTVNCRTVLDPTSLLLPYQGRSGARRTLFPALSQPPVPSLSLGLLREVAGPTAAVVPGDRSAGAGARQPQHDAWGHFHGRGLRRLRPPQLPDGLR